MKKITILALLILAAILALASVSGIQTYKAYTEYEAADSSFVMQVPGEYVELENLEYLRQQYGIEGNTIFGFGVPEGRGVLVARKIIQSLGPAITNEEVVDALTEEYVSANTQAEKVIINDVAFIKIVSPNNLSIIFFTYNKGSLYAFVFSNLGPTPLDSFKREVYNTMNSLKFNPDPNL